MNKYQEALDTLVKYAHESPNLKWVLIHEENIIQELVDKATPMKPIVLEPCHYDCGKCHSTIHPIGCKRTWHKQFNKYCPNCGQAILWEE